MMAKQKYRRSILALYSGIALLVLAIIILYLLSGGASIKKMIGAPKEYSIADECSIILNNIIHQIKTDGDCRIKCRNECGIRGESFFESNFTEEKSRCSTCICYCR